VHWNVTWSAEQQQYVKEPADQPGYNFVWSPQWQVQMHQPETWGYLQFSATPGDHRGIKMERKGVAAYERTLCTVAKMLSSSRGLGTPH
jgi:hypothetical protein